MNTPIGPRAGQRAVERLHRAGILDAAGRQRALDLVAPPRRWRAWTGRLLASVGSALVLAGIVYFFAFNWARLPGLAKLAIAGLGLLLALARPLARGSDDPAGKLAMCAAGMMLGVFLAVFGQVYQTGADAYELFAGWAALGLGWALLARSAPLWMLWAVVANLAVGLFFVQASPLPGDWEALALVVLVGLNSAGLAVREVVVTAGATWLAPRWTRYILGYAVIGCAAFPMLSVAFDPGRSDPGELVAALAGLAAHLWLGWLYRWRRPDIGLLGGVALSVCILLEVVAFQAVEDWWRSLEALVFLLLAGFTVALFAGAVSWLRHVSGQVDLERHHA